MSGVAPLACAIETDALCRNFRNRPAVSDLTLTVPAGVVFGLLGPNGAGKTTTIRLLLGLLEPSSGRASVLGWDARTQGEAIRTHTGALLEHTGLYERLSAEENLEFYARIARMPQPQRHARIGELLSHLGLWDRRAGPVANWSRGMKQRLAIARAMLHRPRLLLLDEPTAGLDPIAAAALREELAALVLREGVTLFLTTHNLVEAESLCDRVAVLRDGRLVATGTPREIRAGIGRPRVAIVGRGFGAEILDRLRALPQVEAVEMVKGGSSLEIALHPQADVAGIVALIVGQGGAVEEVRRDDPGIEEAFLALVGEAP